MSTKESNIIIVIVNEMLSIDVLEITKKIPFKISCKEWDHLSNEQRAFPFA